MEKLNPWVMGAALAVTFVVVYALCAAAFAIAPTATIGFFNAWFHGLNLAGLQTGAKPFTFGVFLYGTTGIAAVAFVCGVVFATSYNLLRRCCTARTA
jgi:hypothetical protein